MTKIISADDIIGEVDTDLINNNQINSVAYTNNNYIISNENNSLSISFVDPNYLYSSYYTKENLQKKNVNVNIIDNNTNNLGGYIYTYCIFSYRINLDEEILLNVDNIKFSIRDVGIFIGDSNSNSDYSNEVPYRFFDSEQDFIDFSSYQYAECVIGIINDDISKKSFKVMVRYKYINFQSTKFTYNLTVNANINVYKKENISNVYPNTINNADFSLEDSELINKDVVIYNIENGNLISQNIIKNYKNGKQTVNLKLSLTNYDNLHNINEEVFIRDTNGNPYFYDENGNEKKFKITSAEIEYTGKCYQNLKLLEITGGDNVL